MQLKAVQYVVPDIGTAIGAEAFRVDTDTGSAVNLYVNLKKAATSDSVLNFLKFLIHFCRISSLILHAFFILATSSLVLISLNLKQKPEISLVLHFLRYFLSIL